MTNSELRNELRRLWLRLGWEDNDVTVTAFSGQAEIEVYCGPPGHVDTVIKAPFTDAGKTLCFEGSSDTVRDSVSAALDELLTWTSRHVALTTRIHERLRPELYSEKNKEEDNENV